MSTVDAAWFEEYRRKLARERIPMSVSLELTHRCNLRCVHCYLGSDEDQRESTIDEMGTEDVKHVIDEVVEAGCLYLLITGGEPMMRRDFGEIYRHARERGLVVTVFSEGALVDDATVELFQSLPPQMVEITLYGATAETFERITRVKGSYEKCIEGVHRLLAGGVRVGLKTVLMTLNSHELEAMRKIADDLDVPFRMDTAIFPCIEDGDQAPIELRVDPDVGVADEFADKRVEKEWRDYVAARREMPVSERLYSCGAGVTGLSIDPYGFASPCLMTAHIRANILERGFQAVWNDELKRLQEKRPREGYACSSCEMRAACSVCPAFNYLETGEEDVRSDYLCATTVARWQRLTGKSSGGLPVVNQTAGTGK